MKSPVWTARLPANSFLLTGGAVAAASALALPGPAQAMPQYAQQTGLACGSCHVSPSGGGALKRLGKQFQANGHKLPGKRK